MLHGRWESKKRRKWGEEVQGNDVFYSRWSSKNMADQHEIEVILLFLRVFHTRRHTPVNSAVTLFVASSEMPWTVCQKHLPNPNERENTRPRKERE